MPNRTKPEQYLLRLPDGLRDRLKAEAKAAGRSLNTHIVHLLELQSSAKTLRDEFAMAAIMAEWGNGEAMTPEDSARLAYQLADAMMEEREVRYG